MPMAEYQCSQCDLRFSRVVLRGEPAAPAVCPRCRTGGIRALPADTGLFDGIADFSELARDTN